MRIVIAGGHGKIGLRLAQRLGTGAVGIVRDPAQVADVEATGAEGVLRGADAVVFAAGAGPGSGAARKDTVDRGAAVLLAQAAERAGVRRFIQISSMGAGKPPAPGSDEVWQAYIRAKTEAEDDLRGRDLDWTIVRPGRLTDEPGTGLVRLAPEVPPGSIPRDDVAAVVLALLEAPGTARRTFELVAGDTPVIDLVATE